ncbi:energy-coupling factor transporter ATPase [Dictyoglomus thermophilum]|uniref:energy-coupling factor transporter ATPase n=1 Tax=Dictyoglomus thermophilum TaxID=14 RepID=UPI0011EA910F|nr:energy-coupling factor transporter ATPase [Dictyoglomus thermophilum]TYT20981.1 energy-coupling factor transporter ATPase [Dictyoglomus thermophilum]
MIEIKSVSYVYQPGTSQEKVALRNVNLEIPSPSFFCIVGANGSGKSTFARLLNGLYTPTSGDVIVDGINTKDEEKIWEIRKNVGLVFQNPDNQIIGMTVEEDVAFGCENLGLPPEEIEERIEFALRAVGMEEYRKYPPYLLSGGQKQRVAIAGILAMMPKYIVLDEPTTMLDPKGRKDIINIIRKLYEEEKKTIILITHHMEEVVWAEKVVVFFNGEIVDLGTPKEIFLKEERLDEWGLNLPITTKISKCLSERGFNLPHPLLTPEELALWL